MEFALFFRAIREFDALIGLGLLRAFLVLARDRMAVLLGVNGIGGICVTNVFRE
jgi:hypothetical protein